MQVVIAAARESETRKNSPKVADLMMRARALGQKPQTRDNWLAVEVLLRQVLRAEPENLLAKSGLVRTLTVRTGNFPDIANPKADEILLEESRTLAVQVKARDPENIEALMTLMATTDDQIARTALLEQVLLLAPKNVGVLTSRGVYHFYDGEGEKALARFEAANALKAVRDDDNYLVNAGRAHFMIGHDEQAIKMLESAINKNPVKVHYYSYIAMAYARLGQMNMASKARDSFVLGSPLSKLSNYENPQKSSTDAYKQWHATQFVPAWRKAGLPE